MEYLRADGEIERLAWAWQNATQGGCSSTNISAFTWKPCEQCPWSHVSTQKASMEKWATWPWGTDMTPYGLVLFLKLIRSHLKGQIFVYYCLMSWPMVNRLTFLIIITSCYSLYVFHFCRLGKATQAEIAQTVPSWKSYKSIPPFFLRNLFMATSHSPVRSPSSCDRHMKPAFWYAACVLSV